MSFWDSFNLWLAKVALDALIALVGIAIFFVFVLWQAWLGCKIRGHQWSCWYGLTYVKRHCYRCGKEEWS